MCFFAVVPFRFLSFFLFSITTFSFQLNSYARGFKHLRKPFWTSHGHRRVWLPPSPLLWTCLHFHRRIGFIYSALFQLLVGFPSIVFRCVARDPLGLRRRKNCQKRKGKGGRKRADVRSIRSRGSRRLPFTNPYFCCVCLPTMCLQL